MSSAPESKAVVLLSGGLDSATALAVAVAKGYDCYAISFDYGQRHRIELSSASRVAKTLGAIEHRVIPVGLSGFGGSALTGQMDVPKHADVSEVVADIPVTYVPARNTVFLSLALAWAEVLGSTRIFIGVNALDYSGYPDCRPEYIAAFEAMANLATRAGVEGSGRLEIVAPLIAMSKAEIIRLGIELGVDYSITHSCYDPSFDGRPCLHCDSCLLRIRGFEEAGLRDPLLDS